MKKLTTKKKLLIVDDNVELSKTLCFILKNNGYEVQACETWSEGQKSITRQIPDLIIMDINLGKNDGLEICKELKNNQQFSHIPIIIMTALEKMHNIATECEADDFLAKPFNLDEMLAKINKAVQKNTQPQLQK